MLRNKDITPRETLKPMAKEVPMLRTASKKSVGLVFRTASKKCIGLDGPIQYQRVVDWSLQLRLAHRSLPRLFGTSSLEHCRTEHALTSAVSSVSVLSPLRHRQTVNLGCRVLAFPGVHTTITFPITLRRPLPTSRSNFTYSKTQRRWNDRPRTAQVGLLSLGPVRLRWGKTRSSPPSVRPPPPPPHTPRPAPAPAPRLHRRQCRLWL